MAESDPDLADIQAALAWYFDHRTGIAAGFAARDAFVAALRARQPDPLGARLADTADGWCSA
ncbi:MAG: hypothetical protein EA400_13550 [Chromatiaceae bacterium]|nr:MAG: hypothetical protein EA400_13550 [Chromatiaceae bacterium]